MKNLHSSKIITLVILLILSGCFGNTKIDKPIIPSNDEVLVIEVSINSSDEPNKFVITDKGRIQQVLLYIDENLNEWYRPFDTYPSPQISATFKTADNKVVFILWMGANWIGGDDDIIDSIGAGLSESSETDIQNLKRLLSIENV